MLFQSAISFTGMYFKKIIKDICEDELHHNLNNSKLIIAMKWGKKGLKMASFINYCLYIEIIL